MPYAPPCCDDEHTAVVCPCSDLWEDIRVEKEYKSESGVLDTSLDCDGSSVLVWKLEQCTCSESDSERKEVMQKHDKEDVADTLHEYIQVSCKDDDHHGDENHDRKVLERLLEQICDLWKVLSAEDTQHERNTHDDEDALEDVAERNHEFRKLADVVVSCEIKVHLAPECKIERGC